MNITVESCKEDQNMVKCPRCWHWHYIKDNFGHLESEIEIEAPEKQEEMRREKLCDRCQKVILDHYPNHPSVPHIKEALKKQREKWGIK